MSASIVAAAVAACGKRRRRKRKQHRQREQRAEKRSNAVDAAPLNNNADDVDDAPGAGDSYGGIGSSNSGSASSASSRLVALHSTCFQSPVPLDVVINQGLSKVRRSARRLVLPLCLRLGSALHRLPQDDVMATEGLDTRRPPSVGRFFSTCTLKPFFRLC